MGLVAIRSVSMLCGWASPDIDIASAAAGRPPPCPFGVGVAGPKSAEVAAADRLAYPSMLGLGVTSDIAPDMPNPYPALYSMLVLLEGLLSPSRTSKGLGIRSLVSAAPSISD